MESKAEAQPEEGSQVNPQAVTAIKYVFNATTASATVHNFENGRSEVVNPGTGEAVDHWIPWCTDPGSFPEHHIQIKVGSRSYEIWQCQDSDGDKVRLSRDGRYHGRPNERPALAIGPVASVNGDRLLVLAEGAIYLDRKPR